VSPRRRNPLIAVLVVLVPVLLIGGIWLGGHPDRLPGFARNTLVADHDTYLVNQAIDKVAHDYYRPLKKSQLVNGSITGLLSSLKDPYSSYLTPSDFQSFGQAASFSGVGIVVTHAKRGLLIEQVFDQSPAKRAGIHQGDLITAVNGRTLSGVSLSASRAMISGKPGTDVKLTLDRHGVSRTQTITRATISEPIVASSLRTVHGKKLGWVYLATFAEEGAHAQVAQSVQKLLHRGARGLVLDLRANGGGLVTEAQLIASLFIPSGTIVSTRGRHQPTTTLSAVGGAISGSIPMVVLVDRDTASASEIVTAALQDHHRATVVGTHTFGKGVFQELESLPNGAAIKLTVGSYYTPNGRNLGGSGVKEGAGITPDVPIAKGEVDTPRALAQALDVLAAKLH
jgi:carboxyl-terminal processing protease